MELSVKQLFDQMIEVLNLLRPFPLLTLLLVVFALIVKAIKKVDSSMDKLRRVEMAMKNPEIDYPDFVPPLETCLYCGVKLTDNTRLCPSCHNPI